MCPFWLSGSPLPKRFLTQLLKGLPAKASPVLTGFSLTVTTAGGLEKSQQGGGTGEQNGVLRSLVQM